MKADQALTLPVIVKGIKLLASQEVLLSSFSSCLQRRITLDCEHASAQGQTDLPKDQYHY